jgi:hypothetical protein
MSERTFEDDVEASIENLAEGETTVREHAEKLSKDYGVSVEHCELILNYILKQEAEDAALDDRPWGEQQSQVDWLERDRGDSPPEPMEDY